MTSLTLALNTWLGFVGVFCWGFFFFILKGNFHSDSKFQFGGLVRVNFSTSQDRECWKGFVWFWLFGVYCYWGFFSLVVILHYFL